MTNSVFSDEEVTSLLLMEKVSASSEEYIFPALGGSIEVPLIARSGTEKFILNVGTKRIALATKYQMRGRGSVVLARLDFGAPHRNPDGVQVASPHLHIYKEGYGDKWAIPVPEGMLSNSEDRWQVLLDFMSYCHVVEMPNISRGLFV